MNPQPNPVATAAAAATNRQADRPASVTCPECDGAVALDASPMAHEIVSCAECGAELEVISLDPLTVELAPEVEEDWGE